MTSLRDVARQLRDAFGAELELYERVGRESDGDSGCLMVEAPVAAVARLIVQIQWRPVGTGAARRLESQARLMGAALAPSEEEADVIVPSSHHCVVRHVADEELTAARDDASTRRSVVRLLRHALLDIKSKWLDAQLQALRTCANQRLAFEEELLRPATTLELAQLQRSDGANEMVLSLSSRKTTTAVEDTKPNDSAGPRPPTAHLILRAPMDATGADLQAWRIEARYAEEASLSREVVGQPTWSTHSSTVELFSAWQQTYEHQWQWRRHLIDALQERIVVLEYDALDLAHVHVLLQDHTSSEAAFVLVIVRISFTPTFFVTMCLSDLRVSLLDGVTSTDDAPSLVLPSITVDINRNRDRQDVLQVAQSLHDALHQELRRHLRAHHII
ncbi:hypothetical protein PINS_up011457 [Pythium insidiosum]|nr:hypothetical protein PINS_up011457 [Pythium insidiosum]